MITGFLIGSLVMVVSAIVGSFPIVASLNIPGFPIDDWLSTGMGYIAFLSVVFPPLGIMLNGFLAIMVWKGTLLSLQLLRIIR